MMEEFIHRRCLVGCQVDVISALLCLDKSESINRPASREISQHSYFCMAFWEYGFSISVVGSKFFMLRKKFVLDLLKFIPFHSYHYKMNVFNLLLSALMGMTKVQNFHLEKN